MLISDIPQSVRSLISAGTAIPAHPLALDAKGNFDRRCQRALSRYYIDAGCGGLAVGVHTTQFRIRDVNLYRPVLELAAQTADDWTDRPLALIAGVAGKTAQAVAEAETARSLGYHAALVSPAPFRDAAEAELLDHARAVADVMPIIGFYLQPAVGGRVLSAAFWERFSAIENVISIKIAPFHRHRTIDVVRGLVNARAQNRITLYTGNDDHIVADLLTPFPMMRNGETVTVRIKGGLLGQWSVWTRAAVRLLQRCRDVAQADAPIPADLLGLDAQLTDVNAAIFDVANDFAGVIAGCHEVLRREGLLESTRLLDPDETLSPGQAEEITRVAQDYPHLTDGSFVRDNLTRWMSD